MESKELREYIKETRKTILAEQEEGLELVSDIEFDLTVINTKEMDGGIRLFVVNAKGRKELEHFSRIKFKMGFRAPTVD